MTRKENMSRILDALEDTGRNADRKLYTILTGKEIGKKNADGERGDMAEVQKCKIF